MKNWLTHYFDFKKREYNGILVLLTLLLLMNLFPFVYARYRLIDEDIAFDEQKSLQHLIIANEENHRLSAPHFADETEGSSVSNKVQLFDFDPNKIELRDWQKLGLSVKQANAVINYRNKGGKFYKPQDLQKMYTITVQKYLELLPFVKIEEQGRGKFQKNFYRNSSADDKEAVSVELNNADTLELDKIRGIGAAFARRIFNYRERLGGFYQKEQLREVYGLDSLKFEEIKNQVRIDESYIRKIDINMATFDDLKRHPYLKYKQINAIIQYRNQHGRFNNLADLKKVVILTAENIQQLAPYLTF